MSGKYELFSITPDILKLQEARKAYVESLGEQIFYKIVSNRSTWFYYSKGVFDVRKMLGSKFFEFDMVPDKLENDKHITEDFVQYGVSNVAFIKAVRDLSRTFYFYVPNNSLNRIGRRFMVYPVIPLSEDIYFLSLLELRDFRKIDIQDASKYRDFFSVSDKPNFVFDKSRLRLDYEAGKFSLEEYNNIVTMFDNEERVVRTLRK